MGGNLFNGTRRHSTCEIYESEKDIFGLCHKLGLEYVTIQSLTHKEDHGDYDLIINRDTLTYDSVKHIYENYECAINGKFPKLDSFFNDTRSVADTIKKIDVLSFKLNELQVDFIMIEEDSINFSSCYHSFNDLGGIIGTCLRPMGVFLGREGIYIKYRPNKDSLTYKIYLTKDWDKFASVFSIDNEIYHDENKKLRNYEDLYEYLKNFKYFNSSYMDPSMMNATRRNRAAKRKVFNYIANSAYNEGGVVNYNVDEIDVDALINQFDDDWIKDQKNKADDDYRRMKEKELSLSKNRIQRVLGYCPSNVGDMLKNIGLYYGGSFKAKEYLCEVSDDEFENIVRKFM